MTNEACRSPAPPDCTARRGRRAQSLIAAARTLFLERGYERTSVAEVVRAGGGSLATLYAEFGSKRGLLETVIRAEQFEGLARLTARLDAGGPPAVVLAGVAEEMVRALLGPDLVALIRLIVSEGLHHPRFAVEMQAGFDRPLLERLTARFRAWHETGLIAADPQHAAEMFASLFCYAPQMRLLFLDHRDLDCGLIERRVRFQVETFVAGITAPRRP